MVRKIGIFQNCITQRFKDTELEEEYFSEMVKFKTLIIWFIIMGFWTCFYIFLHNYLPVGKNNPNKKMDIQGVITNSVLSILLLIFTIVTTIKRKKICRLLFFVDTFLINLSLYIVFMETYFILLSFTDFKAIIFTAHILFLFELILRIIWHCTVEYCFLVNFFAIVFSISFDMTGFAKNINMSCMFPLQIVKLFGIFIIYMLERRERKIFYLNKNQLKESKKMKMLINEIHCGIITFSFEDNELEYNNLVKQKILNDESMTKENQIIFLKKFLFTDLEIINPESKEKQHEILYNLLKDNQTNGDIFLDMKSRENQRIEVCEIETARQTNENFKIMQSTESKNIKLTEEIIQVLKQSTTSNQYILLGIKHVLDSSFQIFARFVECENQIEFVLHDIAMVSKFEEIQAMMKYKSLFLAKVCHEFRNPLMNIIEIVKNCSDMIEYDPKTQHECDSSSQNIILRTDQLKSGFVSNLKTIKNISLFMSNLISDFEFISKNGTNENGNLKDHHDNFISIPSANANISLTSVSIPELIDECVDIYQTKIELNCKNLILQKHVSQMPKLITDERKIKQIILNLLSNSFKFSNYGEITIEASYISSNDNEFLDICVKDTGVGIPEEKLNLIQEPFMKLDSNHNRYGLGLGLSIVKSLINVLGGSFSILSALGQGTQASFEIPVGKSKFLGESDRIAPKHLFESKSCLDPKDSLKEISFSNRDEDTEQQITNQSQRKFCGKDTFRRKTQDQDLFFIIDPTQKEGLRYSSSCEFIVAEPKQESYDHIVCDDHMKPYIAPVKLLRENKNVLSALNKSHDIATYRFLVVDDEKLIRESHKKLIENFFYSQESKRVVEIIECNDGAECIYQLYQSTINGKKVDAIFSDESMNFIRGSVLYKLIQILLHDFIICQIKFFLVTSYEVFDTGLDEKYIFKKPLTKNQVAMIINNLL